MPSLFSEDSKGCVAKINADKPCGLIDGKPEVASYDWDGNRVPAEEMRCVAKAVKTEAGTRYWVKRATSGLDAGRLYNKNSPNYTGNEKRNNDALGRSQFEFQRVTEEAFDLYVRYLKDPKKNPSLISNAERAR